MHVRNCKKKMVRNSFTTKFPYFKFKRDVLFRIFIIFPVSGLKKTGKLKNRKQKTVMSHPNYAVIEDLKCRYIYDRTEIGLIA